MSHSQVPGDKTLTVICEDKPALNNEGQLVCEQGLDSQRTGQQVYGGHC